MSTVDPKHTCKNCIVWVQNKSLSENFGAKLGYCHLNPVKEEVAAKHWCGKFFPTKKEISDYFKLAHFEG